MSMIHSSVLVPGTNKWPDADAVVTRDAHAVVTHDAVVTREMVTFILRGNWDV
jgi:hypothetical protein